MARRLAGWLTRAREAQAQAEVVKPLKAAEAWLKRTVLAIRNDRFSPIAQQTKALWAQLRQQSNVDLKAVVLGGTGTRRRVELEVTVDGVDGVALGVMSQGELHALALSLFLPRATLPASPFRFLVIDDPVQSMDPARVDGLARVLEQVASQRQVLVFTHDDRLPEAVRRLRIDASVLAVTRRAGSVVEVRIESDPVHRALDDARALARTDNLPPDIARRVVPGFCRDALEAACLEAFRRRRLERGEAHADVEAAWEAATSLTHRAALAIFNDPGRGGDVQARLNQLAPGGLAAYRACQTGSHHGFSGNLDALVADTGALANALLRLS